MGLCAPVRTCGDRTAGAVHLIRRWYRTLFLRGCSTIDLCQLLKRRVQQVSARPTALSRAIQDSRDRRTNLASPPVCTKPNLDYIIALCVDLRTLSLHFHRLRDLCDKNADLITMGHFQPNLCFLDREGKICNIFLLAGAQLGRFLAKQ